MTVAQEIKSLVDEKGISYTFISAKTGIPVDAISKTFMGKRKPTADEMIAICSVTGIDLSDLSNSSRKR